MRNVKPFLLISLSVFMLLSFASIGVAKDHPWDMKPPFKSGTIEYSLSGMEDGTETLYIKEYGTETARYHTGKTTMMGMTMETKTVEIVDPDWIYEYDLVEQTGYKSANPTKYLIEEFNALSSADKKKAMKNAEAMGANYAGMGAVEKNVAEIQGYPCDKVAAMGAVTHVIHGTDIPLKVEMNTMGMKMDVIAVSVKEGRVSGKHFDHPEGIEAMHDQQGTAAAKSMAQEVVAALVEGEMASPNSNTAHAQQRMEHVPAEDQAEMEQAMEMMKGLFGN